MTPTRSAASGVGLLMRHLRTGWPFVVLTIAIAPLLWMAVSVAVHAGLFELAGAPGPNQLGAFVTFIGTSLAAVATVFAALLTRAHNVRERHRLRLETVVKSLEMLPDTSKRARIAGVLSTMVLLGQERVAMRVLHPAWEDGDVDDGTATWLIGQVLAGGRSRLAREGDQLDDVAMREAAVLLFNHSSSLTGEKAGQYYFAGHFMRQWRTKNHLPPQVKLDVLRTMGQMLVDRGREWWSPTGELPYWPTIVLLECARKDPHRGVRSSAAVLLAALRDSFPQEFGKRVPDKRMTTMLTRAEKASSVPAEHRKIAASIRRDWRSLSAEASTGQAPIAPA
jgi:hypothetical protein